MSGTGIQYAMWVVYGYAIWIFGAYAWDWCKNHLLNRADTTVYEVTSDISDDTADKDDTTTPAAA